MTSPTTTATTTTTTSGAATLTTPAGYTSRFVAHVDHGQTHQASSNSSNPHDRNRFRTFSDEHAEPSTNRVEDYEIAAKNADYDIDGSMVKPQSSKRTHGTDDSTDTDETITSSFSSSATRTESLEGSGHGNRVENRNEVHQDALVDGRSGNDVSSSLSVSVADVRVQDGGNLPRTDDASNATRPLENSRGEPADDEERGSRDESSSNSISTASNSESDSESGTETDSETDEEEDESRDENSNVKTKKTENPEKEDDGRILEGEDNASDGDGSTDSETDDETTILSVRANPPTENNYSAVERYDDAAKRRSSSIIGEKSIEELFDDNGWVITDQDLQAEGPQRISRSFKPIDQEGSRASSNENGEPPSNEHKQNSSEKFGEARSGSNDADDTEKNDDDDDDDGAESGKTLSVSESSESLPRSRVYRQSSIGKNGWLVSDESDNESDRAISPMRNNSENREALQAKATDALRNVKTVDRRKLAEMMVNEKMKHDDPSSMLSAAMMKEGLRDKDSMVTDNAWSIDENGWVVLNKVNVEPTGKDVEGKGTDETSTIRSQTTDLLVRTNIENGALVANTTQSKETDSTNEHGVDISIPMQMVTTVFCVSVLCYSLLINLFL